MNIETKFKIGDRVCLAEDQTGNPWYVIGVVMRPCYNVVAWEYHLGRALYGDYPMSSFGCSCDVTIKGPLREEQIITEETWLEQQKAALDQEIAETERRLAELKSRKQV